MSYKAKKTWKDLVEHSHHHGLTRRQLLSRGLATGALGLALPKFFGQDLIKTAYADAANCPPPLRNPGAIAQIFSEGGPTMGARFISEAQAAMMNAGIAANYGITGQANLVKLGPNMVIDSTSPFGFTLLQGPPGYSGGPSAWKANVLSKISGGGHLGPFNADDGAGQDSGLLGGMSPFKNSQMGKDLQIGVNRALASWAKGLPAAAVSSGNLSPTSLSKVFSMTPAAAGLTNAQALNASSDAAASLAQAFSGVANTSLRKAGSQLLSTATCAFYGNSALADPTYGTTLFNPTNISALTSKLTVSSLSNEEQAQIAAFYQSAAGVAGGVVMQFGGRDYHGDSPQNVIAPADIEEARAIVMFLAACDAAQAPGAMMYFSNGQAIAEGTQAVTATINGQTANLNAPVAKGDGGGAYNAGLIIFYNPNGAGPSTRFTGKIAGNSGNATTDPAVGSSNEAVAGLYLSALSWINGGTIPSTALSAMRAASVAANPANTMVIG